MTIITQIYQIYIYNRFVVYYLLLISSDNLATRLKLTMPIVKCKRLRIRYALILNWISSYLKPFEHIAVKDMSHRQLCACKKGIFESTYNCIAFLNCRSLQQILASVAYICILTAMNSRLPINFIGTYTIYYIYTYIICDFIFFCVNKSYECQMRA